MVIGDDHAQADLPRVGELRVRGDAVIDGDAQLDTLRAGVVQRALVEPVAVIDAMGQIPVHLAAQRGQRAHQQRGGGDAVGIVVAEDAHAPAAREHLQHRADRLRHIRHQQRVMQARRAAR